MKAKRKFWVRRRNDLEIEKEMVQAFLSFFSTFEAVSRSVKDPLRYSFSALVKDQAYRKRRGKRPNLPKTIEEVNIALYSDLTKTKDGKPFYRGKTKSCAELFMTDVQIQIAAEADTIFIDGTFSTCPAPFFQIVYITAKVGENTYPVATALLPNKLEETYKDVVELFCAVCEEHGMPVDFVFVHSDCEPGLINGVKAVLPNIQPRLCRFHIVDAIRRKANSLGLRPLINRSSDMKIFYGRLQQIFFFPINIWHQIWKLLKRELGDELREQPAVQSFILYLVSAFQQ